MEKREHDLFLDMASNTSATFEDLILAGVNAKNTALQDRTAYEQDDWVRALFEDLYGNFDKVAFDTFYDNVKIKYNSLALTDYNETMMKQASYHRDNIFAPIELRRRGPDFIEYRMSNPFLITLSVHELGRVGQRTKSIDELAQANKVLLNPTSAGENLENAQWGDSPNDSFWGYFDETLVLAQYDTKGTHPDPITGEIVEHNAGDPKLDKEGNFYYEKLDGRDIYGRRVLNKMNVLTVDGSRFNDYDFFDSDDLNLKSVGSTALKNLALVGTMFIPYVGPWIAGLSVATQTVGLLGTLGKMIDGSDHASFSEMEGWAKSMSRLGNVSEYAQQNTWCWENYINLVGDIAGLLRELRFLFEKAPRLFTGSNLMTKEGQAAKLQELIDTKRKLNRTTIDLLRNKGTSQAELLRAETTLNNVKVLESYANNELSSLLKDYNNIGSVLSKGYMTAITVGDTYGEAKLAGASDLEATLLTLGYAAGEYKILSTGLGEWIMPELRAGRFKNEAIAKALTTLGKKTELNVRGALSSKESKKEYVKKLFNIGKNIARAEYSKGTRTATATLAAATGEGVEEVSEELLADFSKGCFDVVKWLQGDDTRINTFGYDFSKGEWNGKEIIDRYGMSLFGGFLGGGLTNLGTNYKMLNDYSKIDSQQAVQELVYMARNGGLDDFMKQVNKMLLGNSNLSINLDIIDGTPVYDPGTEVDNLDLAIKKVIQNQVNMILSILAANGAVSDNRFLDILTLGDMRFAALLNSKTAGLYLQKYNSLFSDIYTLTNDVNDKLSSVKDTNNDNVVTDKEDRRSRLSETDKAAVDNLEKKIKEKKKELKDLLEGKSALDFVFTSLFEMNTGLSGVFTTPTFTLFAELEYGRKYSELTENLKDLALKKYENWSTTEGREQTYRLAQIFRKFVELASNTIKSQELTYMQTSPELLELNTAISHFYDVIRKDGMDIYLPSIGENSEFLSAALVASSSAFSGINKIFDLAANQIILNKEINPQLAFVNNTLFKLLATDEQRTELLDLLQRISQMADTATEEEATSLMKLYVNKLDSILISNAVRFATPFLERGFANTETKNLLTQLLTVAKDRAKGKENNWNDAFENGFVDDDVNPYTSTREQIESTLESVSQLSATPIELNLNEFSNSIGGESINLTQLMERLNTIFNDVSDSVSKFDIDGELFKDLNNAIWTLKMYQAAIRGARTDGVNLNNLYGFNATINEVADKLEGVENPKLAEIDKNVADVFDLDILAALNKLEFLLKLYTVNKGQKLTRHERVATKKDLLIYKRLKGIISVLDDDPLKNWEGLLELQNAIGGMTLHDLLSGDKNATISDSQQEDFERENLAAENAIYDFFLANRDKLSDPNKLVEFLNPKRFQLYNKARGLLNENLEDYDDNSLVWWLATRAALRAQDFYHQYALIIDPKAEHPIAPVSALELGIYTNYASIVNGDVFTAFYKAYRLAVVLDWLKRENETELQVVERRKKILELQGVADEHLDFLSKESNAKYAINFLTAPRYLNIVLTEGIPGGGKSSAVFRTTAKLIKKFHPEFLLSAIVVDGVSVDNANAVRDGMELDKEKTKTFDRTLFMRYINSNWREYSTDETGESYVIPKEDYMLTDENEIRSKLKINDNNAPPSIIFIDEISRFSAYDLDLIDKFAKKYGISVLAAGDFDQSGIVGGHNIPGLGYWLVDLSSTNFIGPPKIGMSMRTDNSVKTGNLLKMLSFIQDPKGTISFDYYQDETGLYGDRVLPYAADMGETTQGQVDAVLLYVELMKRTLKRTEDNPNPKITFVYSDPNSPIYNALNKDEYKDYIQFKHKNLAQGPEGLYYIIEADPTVSQEVYLKSIYTGMSRSSQGSVIIAPTKYQGISFTDYKLNEKFDEPLPVNTIAAFAKKRKDILSKIASDGLVPAVIPRTAEVRPLPAPQTGRGLAPGVSTELTIEELKAEIILEMEEAEDIAELDSIFEQVKIDTPELGNDPDIIEAHLRISNRLAPPDNNLSDITEAVANIKSEAGLDDDTIANSTINNSDNLLLGSAELSKLPSGTEHVDSRGISGDNAIEGLLTLLTNGIPDSSAFEPVMEPLLRDNPFTNSLFIVAAQKSSPDDLNLLALSGIKTVLINTGDPDNPLSLLVATKLKEILSAMFPKIDFVLFTEAADYYKALESKKAEDPPTLPLIDSSEYTDDQAPITLTSLLDEETYKQLLDDSNKTQNLEESTAVSEGTLKAIEMLIHTFNTFEVGVLTDDNGMPTAPKLWMDSRIDSAFGLIKVDKLLGNPIRTVELYKVMIGDLRSILLNTADKTLIIEKIRNYLGLPEIYCTFALKSSPYIDRNHPERLTDGYLGNPTPFGKSIYEETEFNGTNDIRSGEWHPKSIVAIIGIKGNKNILELPLASLSSPFTLLQTKDKDGGLEYIKMYNDYLAMKKLYEDLGKKPKLYEIAKNLWQKYDGDPQYQALANLFKLFCFTDAAVWYIRDPQWTPVGNLQHVGPQYVLDKGYYQIAPGMTMDETTHPKEEWINVSEYAKNPNCTMTEKVMISKDGYVGDSDVQVVNPGHPFILVSYNKDLDTDSKIIDLYVKLKLDDTVRKEVELIYVLPPEATISLYFDNLRKIFKKDPDRLYIGNLFTSYHLLEVLMLNDEFKTILDSRLRGAVEDILKILNKLKGKSIKSLQRILRRPRDWTKIGGVGRQVTAGLLDTALLNVAYTIGSTIDGELIYNKDDTGMALIERLLNEAGIDGIYHKVRYPKNGDSNGYFIIPPQGANYTIDGKPFRIHGKLDSYTLKGNMDWLVTLALSQLVLGLSGHLYSTDNLSYMTWDSTNKIGLPGNSDIASRPVKSKLEVENEKIIKNTVNYVKRKLGIDVSAAFDEEKPIQTSLKLIAANINADDNLTIAFVIGNELLISNKSEEIKGPVYIYDDSDSSVTDISNMSDNNGKYRFTVSYSGERLLATYDKTTKELELVSSEVVKEPPVLGVTPDNFAEYIETGRELLLSAFELDPILEEVFNATTYEEFIDALQNMDYVDGDLRIELLIPITSTTGLQALIINDIIATEEFNNPHRGQCDSIKIKF